MEEKQNSPAAATEAPPPSSAEPPSSRRRGGLKRKASILSNSNTSTPPMSLKRQTREKPLPVLFPPIHNGPCTRARQQPNYAESTSFWDAVVVKGDEEGSALPTPTTAKAEEEVKARNEAWEALEAKIEAEYDVVKSRDRSAHVVPNASGWFSWTKVHPIEERSLPSFFNGKSENRTPEIYMEIRNSIMNKFHANPNTQIEAKDLAEISVGELDAREEVMEFLDYWGLINYHPFPEAETEADTTRPMVNADEVAKVDSLIQKLYQFETEKLCSPAAPRTSATLLTAPSRLPQSMITDESVQPEGPSVEYHCNSCSADCSRKRYHCQKQADFDLCTECFNGRKFDSDMSPSDFILMEHADGAGASSGKWTDQETLLLLEALELFSENWNEIAEHVATKTKAQCILHFVQMPIADSFLDCDDEDDASHKTNTDKIEGDASHKENVEKKEVDASLEEKDVEKETDVSVKENAVTVAAKNDTPLSNAPEKKETKDSKPLLNHDASTHSNGQHASSPTDISKSVEPTIAKDDQGNTVNIAVKALKEAFEAVGYLPSPEEKLSFADAGNPVMALAAFLTRLAEHNIATAAARNSLKSVASNASGLQLSARNSFLIENPTDEKKKLDDTERDVPVKDKSAGLTDKIDSSGKQTEENSSLDDGNGSLNDQKDEEDKMLIGEEKESLVSTEKEVDMVAETDLVVIDEKVGSSPQNESNSPNLHKEEAPVITMELDQQMSQFEGPSSSKKESEDSPHGAPSTGVTRSTEAPKDEETISDSVHMKKTKPPQSSTPTSAADNVVNSGEADSEGHRNKNNDPISTKDDQSIHNVKRAAVTAISAAAVKAKLLAAQEEEHIRQLATSLIEKQLLKLEAKLACFTEMDGVIARAREQLERSKQRLYHERAQIIAARLGMSASSARPATQSLPNRIGMTSPNPTQRPPNPMSMPPQRPPLSRPMMAPAPTPTPTLAPALAPAPTPTVSNPNYLPQ